MFNLGITEILALGSLALIVIGPKQLPEVAKTLARVLNELKSATGDLGASLSKAKEETQSVIDDVAGEFSEFSDPEALLNKAAGIKAGHNFLSDEPMDDDIEESGEQLSFDKTTKGEDDESES